MNSSAGEVAQLRLDAQAAAAAGDTATARRHLEQIWDRRPGPASATFLEQERSVLSAHTPLRPVSVAVLRSFTVEPLVPLLRAAGSLHGLDVNVTVGDFNTYAQEMIDGSGSFLAAAPVDVVILAVQACDIAPDLWHDFADLDAAEVDRATDRVINEVASMLDAFRSFSASSVIVHGLEVPSQPALGVADGTGERSHRGAFERINTGLRSIASRVSGVHVLDLDAVVKRVGTKDWHDDAKWIAMRLPIRTPAMPALVDEWLRFILPLTGQISKVLVVDLDNTLWGGVVGEAGIDGIDLDPDRVAGAGHLALQRSILDLRARGILLATCSKNNEADALDVLNNHPNMKLRPEHFSAMRINWEHKADNLRSIATELNVGLDSLAFIDDNPAECDQIRRLLPEVTVIELDTVPRPSQNPITGHPRFERVGLTAEDRDRANMYEQQRSRSEAQAGATSLDDYLHSLGTAVSIQDLAIEDVPRIAQLTQKTNQFNLTTRRYSEADIENFRTNEHVDIISVRASDRFGSHGVIGTAIVERTEDTARIDTLLLSCRVIGRGIETALLSWIVDRSRTSGLRRVDGEFITTAKNQPAAEFFAQNQFTLADSSDDYSRWSLASHDDAVAIPDWIALDIEGEEAEET